MIIGSGVTTPSNNRWTAGLNAGDTNPSLIVGDHCMFAPDVTIRLTDGHPVFDMDTNEQINVPKGSVIIEPYVWVGQGAYLTKGVRVGACSIIGAGSVVTKDVPQRNLSMGVPNSSISLGTKLWSRDYSSESRELMEYYNERYPYDSPNPIVENQIGNNENQNLFGRLIAKLKFKL
nr:acyltransferase [Vibrio sp. D431a]